MKVMNTVDIVTTFGAENIYSQLGVRATKGANGWRQGRCPFHEDKHESFSFNTVSGGWKCHAGCGGGGLVSFIERLYSYEKAAAWRFLCQTVGVNNDAEDNKLKAVAKSYVAQLAGREKPLLSRGLTAKLLRAWGIGWSGELKSPLKTRSNRFTFPVFDELGRVINIRYYKPGAEDQKMLPHIDSNGKAPFGNALYGAHKLNGHPDIVVCEGEIDCINLWGLGIPSVTSTCGAGSWDDSWSRALSGKNVTVLYDNDDAGRSGSRNTAKSLCKYANVSIAQWGEVTDKTDDKCDVTDLIVSGEEKKVRCLLERATRFIPWYDGTGDPSHSTIVDAITAVWVENQLLKDRLNANEQGLRKLREVVRD